MANKYTVKIDAFVDLSKAKSDMDAFMKQYEKVIIGGGSTKTKSRSGGTSPVATGIQSATKAASKGTGVFASFNKQLKSVATNVAASAAINGFTTAIKSSVESVAEMDAKLTEFRKVSNLTGKELDNFVAKATEMGRSVAKTGSEMVEAATEFRKSGFGDAESLDLAKTATLFQNIADSELSAGDAASFIVSQLKAFNMTASQSEHIIDAVNEVSNNFAVSSTDIATGLSKTSSGMAVLGNNYNETIGLLTAGTEIMSGQASKVARGLKCVSQRIVICV